MGHEIVTYTNGPAALSTTTAPLEFSAEQRQMIRNTFASGATDSEFAVLFEIAKARRLNPLLRQIHFVKRYDSMKKCEVWSTQVSIDGLRAIAERTGKYDGQDEPEYAYDDKGQIMSAKVRVYRKDWSRPVTGVAFFGEYAQTTRDGGLTKFWRSMPHVMIAKCAEALAMRKAFPEDTSGLYVPEELGSDAGTRVDYDVTPSESYDPLPPPALASADAARPFVERLAAAASHDECNAITKDAGSAFPKGSRERDAVADAYRAAMSRLATVAPTAAE